MNQAFRKEVREASHAELDAKLTAELTGERRKQAIQEILEAIRARIRAEHREIVAALRPKYELRKNRGRHAVA